MTVEFSQTATRTGAAQPARRAGAEGTRDAAPPETKSRFEDALERRGERRSTREASDGTAAAGEAAPQGEARMTWDGRGGDERRGPRQHAVETVAAAGIAPDAPVAGAAHVDTGEVRPAAPLSLSTDFAAFVARLDLPDRPAETMLQLTMPDTRWLASQATIQRGSDGGLTLDIDTRGNGDSHDGDDARQALRARLEARGHRVDALRTTAFETD
jgi:hypothetical protein